MSFIKDTILGKQAKSSSTTPTGWETLPQQAQDALTSLWSQGQNLSSNIAPYSQPENAALSNLSRQFMPNFNFGQKADAAFGAVQPQVSYANSFLDRGGQQIDLSNMYLGKGTNPISSGEYENSLNMFMNPFTGQVVDSAVRDIRDESARQGSDIASLASTAGAFGGTRQSLLESELGRNTQRTVGDVSGQLRSQGFESSAQKALQALTDERNRYLQAGNTAGSTAGVYGNLAGTANQGASVLNQLGTGYLQGRELMGNLSRQSNLDTLMAGQLQREMPQQGLQLLQQLYGTTLLPLVGGGQTQTERGGTTGLLQGDAGQAGLFAAGASLFSDETMKENIEKVGEKNGLGIYEFNYKNDDRRYRGVMAQEVHEKFPEAISHLAGKMRVNYEMLGLRMEAA
jgi:hypothetical protein